MGTKQLAQYASKYSNGLDRPFLFAGTPVNGAGGTMASRAAIGSQLVDAVLGKYYVCTAVSGGNNVTWTLVGAQT